MHYDIFPKLRGVGYFDNLKKGILNDRIGQAGRNIRHFRAFLLRLFYLGIHENGTAGSQVDGVFGEQSRLGEILHAVI